MTVPLRSLMSVRAQRALTHPVTLLALGFWALNDHFLKEAIPGLLTGKLSDVASLIVFPLLASALTERWMGRTTLPVWLLVTGFVMASINTLDVAAEAYRWGLGAAQWPFVALVSAVRGAAQPGAYRVDLTMDPTDLFTLPALLVPWWLWRRAGDLSPEEGETRLSGPV